MIDLVVVIDNEFARLKKEEYIMDVITELRLQQKECILMFERTSWLFPLRLETATYEHIEMMFAQSVPDYIDGYLLTLDPRNPMPARQLVCSETGYLVDCAPNAAVLTLVLILQDDIVIIAALLYRAAGYEDEPHSV